MRRQIILHSGLWHGLLAATLGLASAARASGDAARTVAAGENLSHIAASYCTPRDRVCIRRYILAIYRANPDVFRGSLDHLKPGDRLRVPVRAEVEAIPEAEALAIYSKGGPLAASASEPASAHATASLPGSADLRRIAGENGRAPVEDSQPLPDPNRMSRLAPVALPEAWKQYEKAPIPDRWRLLNNLGLVQQRWYDPYNQNTYKGDKPIVSRNGFLSLAATLDSLYEYRRLPTPVGAQGSSNGSQNGIFGRSGQYSIINNLILSAVYIKGDTTFKPPEYELHFTPVLNYNHTVTGENGTLNVNPSLGRHRSDQFLGIQELFVDYHLRNVSDRYDFDSIRFGIQPFSSDFRGFLFQDNQLALRLFGNRDNNRWQYNVAWIKRLEKNTNSGLNAVSRKLRRDDTYIINVYRQDFPVLALTSQLTVAHNRNRENGGKYFDDNGFQQRPTPLGTESPRKYDVTYVGYNGDGHLGRLNLTLSTYLATGHQDRGIFSDNVKAIRATFTAAEVSWDMDWLRPRLSAIYQSGDHNPYNGIATGFDAIFENPIIAGANTSFWNRQAVPLIGGGGVALSQSNGILNDLRTSKDSGQSNFENPGLILVGIGADADVLPELRVSGNLNHLWFDSTQILDLARNQGGIHRNIGWDISTALIYRPFFTQNVIFQLSGAMLIPGQGFRDLFPNKESYSVLSNLTLTY